MQKVQIIISIAFLTLGGVGVYKLIEKDNFQRQLIMDMSEQGMISQASFLGMLSLIHDDIESGEQELAVVKLKQFKSAIQKIVDDSLSNPNVSDETKDKINCLLKEHL